MEVEEWLGTDNKIQIDIFNNKYRNNNESFEDWLDRVSGKDEEFKKLIREKKFLPAGRVLANRGLKNVNVTLSNCYYIPLEDNIEGIFDTCKYLAKTYSRGGGCGLTLSNLAPRGCTIHNAAKTSTGAVSFASTFNEITGTIGQENRRGALMLALSSEHPDLEEFIDAKIDTTKLEYANTSVMASDAFMQRVLENEEHTLFFERDTGVAVSKTINAAEIFNKLVHNNYMTGEPGILYWDRVQEHNLLTYNEKFKLKGVNPCGELPLIDFGACLLGSFNLYEYVTADLNFDFTSFEKDIITIVQAMNNILDEGIPLHPLPQQQDTATKWRMIGIGVMSFADALIKMGITYGDEASLKLAHDIAATLFDKAAFASALLAGKEGPYPEYSVEAIKNSSMFQFKLSTETQNLILRNGMRNATLISIAPTGSISTLLGHSNGIEPIFGVKVKRRTESLNKAHTVYEVYSDTVQKVMQRLNTKELPEYIITSEKIDYIKRIEMQAVWQEYVDSAISSTINLPETATEEDIKNIYIAAWTHELKGITIYRDKCSRQGVLSTDEPVKIETDYKAPDDTFGNTKRVSVACGHFLCTVSGVDEQPLKITNTATTGCCTANLEAIQRLGSLAMRSGISPKLITEQLDKVVCKACVDSSHAEHKSCAAGISKVIKDYQLFFDVLGPEKMKELQEAFGQKEVKKAKPVQKESTLEECPSCHEKYEKTAKCDTCPYCGYSRCS